MLLPQRQACLPLASRAVKTTISSSATTMTSLTSASSSEMGIPRDPVNLRYADRQLAA
jgi:BRCT domain type II-containing protein